jgi:hypothetical protein
MHARSRRWQTSAALQETVEAIRSQLVAIGQQLALGQSINDNEYDELGPVRGGKGVACDRRGHRSTGGQKDG